MYTSSGWNSMDLVCRLGSLVMSRGIVYCIICIYVYIYLWIYHAFHIYTSRFSTKSHTMLSSFIHTILISWWIHDLFQYAFWQLFCALLQREQVITFADLAVRFCWNGSSEWSQHVVWLYGPTSVLLFKKYAENCWKYAACVDVHLFVLIGLFGGMPQVFFSLGASNPPPACQNRNKNRNRSQSIS